MNKKGFTLIELLAVIVILAVIALIATPLLMGVINDAKESSIKRSVNNLQHAAETTYATELLMDKNYVFNPADVEYKGEKHTDMAMKVNQQGNASVAIFKNNKCFYALDGNKEVTVDKTDKITCLKKAEQFVPTGDPLALKYCDATTTTECFKSDGNYTGATGTVGNNWLWYGGHLWRVMKEDKNEKSLTLITSYPTTAIQWGDTVANKPSLEQSYVGSWLNEVFYASLPQTVKNNVMPMTYDRKVYNGSSVVNETKAGINVRLLTEAEYIAAGQATSYLNIVDAHWLADIYSASYVRYVSSGGSMSYISASDADGVHPVMKISSNLAILEGNGTLTDPYTVSEERSNNTSNIKVGEYVSVPKSDGTTYLTRVVKNDSGGIKVTLNGLYNTSTFGANTTLTNASTVYTGSLTEFKNTLDTKYFNNSSHNYNITAYPNGRNWNNNTKMATLDIALPSAGEMFSGNDIDLSTSSTKTFVDSSKILNPSLSNLYWLGNSYNTSNVRSVYNNGILSNNGPSNAHGVRPVFYINSSMNIIGGNGTANNPYTLK